MWKTILWITLKKYKNIIKSLFFLDLTGFFVIIEMVFFRIEEVDKHENDIPAKQEKKSKGSWFQSKDEHKRRKKSIG